MLGQMGQISVAWIRPPGFSPSAWTQVAPISGSSDTFPLCLPPPPEEAQLTLWCAAEVHGQILELSQIKETAPLGTML